MKVYRGTDGDLAPVEMEANGWQSANTHFRTEAEAWDSILRSVAAGVKLAGGEVQRAKEQLAKAERQAGEAAVEFKTALDNHRAWKEKQA